MALTTDQLREQAREFRLAADALENAAKVMERAVRLEITASEPVPQLVAIPLPRRLPSRPPTSLLQIREFLAKHGPTKRADLAEKTKIPMGTIDGLLKVENGFDRNPDGTWFLKPQSDKPSARQEAQ
jgi:hypothetical protein